MEKSTTYVGLDVHKRSISVTMLRGHRSGCTESTASAE